MNAINFRQGFGRIIESAGRFFRNGRPETKDFHAQFDIRDHGLQIPDVCDFADFEPVARFPDEHPETAKIYQRFAKAFQTRSKSLFDQSLNRLDQLIRTQFQLTSDENDILNAQLSKLRFLGNWYIDYKETWQRNDRTDLPETPASKQLEELGVFACHVEADQLSSLLQPEIDALLEKKVTGVCQPGSGYDRSLMLNNDGTQDRLFAAIRKLISPHQVLAAASRYHNSHDLDFKHACLHVCQPDDTHFTQTLQDCTTTSKLIGLHIDPKPVMKIIIYLNEVTTETGPFAFIPYSHRWYFREVELLFAKGNSTGNYLHTPAHRKVAAMFPKPFRGNSIVGRFIPDDTPISQKLLESESPVTSEVGNCMVFDPGRGLHRGGICHTGRRINLQIALQ